jgi:ABC-type uncharacterized transport system involved in gliding motility auxiliary subunit
MMNARLKKFAPFGLYLAILAAVFSLGLYIVRHQYDLYLQTSLGLILVGLALAVFLDPGRAREVLTGRQAKYSSNTFVLAVGVIGILVVVNYLVFNNSIQWDVTQNQENTLTTETLDVINSLPQKVTAEAFFTPNTNPASANNLLQNYKYYGKGKFDFQFIDPDADPVTARAANVTRDGTIVLKMGARQEQVTFTDEQEMTSALLRLANPGSRAVYFLTGHGEIDLNGASEKKITFLKTDLESKNYTVKSLNLISTPKIPDDALAIVIDGPAQPLSQGEVSLLKTFVDSGKSLVLLMEPQVLTDFANVPDPLAEYLSKAWGVSFDNDLVIDPSVNPPLAAVANSYSSHLITKKMQGMVTIFPTASSLSIQPDSQDITTSDLIQTSPNAWGETDFASIKNNQVTFDQNKDLTGPLTVAVSAENNVTKSRIVVVSDSDFSADKDYANYGNGIFIVNAIDWAAQQDNLIHLTPRQQTQRLIIPPQEFSMGLVLFGSVFLMPLIILFSGIVVFIQRKRRN